MVLAELAAAALARAARHAPPVTEVGEDEVPVLDHHTRGCGILLSGSFEGPVSLSRPWQFIMVPQVHNRYLLQCCISLLITKPKFYYLLYCGKVGR